MTTTGARLYDVARQLKSAVAVALQNANTPVERAAVYPAAVAWDECECGLLAVAVTRQYLTTSFPDVDASTLPCQGGFVAADLVVQVVRCAPQPDGRDTAPTVADLEASSQLVLNDAWLTLSTVLCLLEDMKDADTVVEYLVRPQPFTGPMGGCVGSTLGVTVAVVHSST